MKRKLNECPYYRESTLIENGEKMVNCAICAFGQKYGRVCTYFERLSNPRPYKKF